MAVGTRDWPPPRDNHPSPPVARLVLGGSGPPGQDKVETWTSSTSMACCSTFCSLHFSSREVGATQLLRCDDGGAHHKSQVRSVAWQF
jgi:hypothetical protein